MAALASCLLAPNATAADLDAVAAEIVARFDTIEHVSPATLAEWRDQSHERDVVLLDVRSEAEYAVGHIPGAIRVPPGSAQPEIMSRIDRPLNGATVVTYCSVGQRSSQLGAKAQTALRRAGAVSVVNLRGGIFAWHNQSRPLVDADGPTKWVHPYSAEWGRYLERDDYAAYEPRD